MDARTFSRVLARLRRVQPGWRTTALAEITAATGRDPFRILVACLLSLRTKDETTGAAAARLFALADSPAAMLALDGVGRKTANLIVTMAFGRPGICVDTHVHRITNRLGFVRTRTPEETERALRRRLPRRHWIPLNDLLVAFGQQVCRPTSPRCSTCPVGDLCPRVGVRRAR